MVAAMALAGLAGCSRPRAETAAPLRAVTVTSPRTMSLDLPLNVVGLLDPKDEARLSFKVGGIIGSLAVEEGREGSRRDRCSPS